MTDRELTLRDGFSIIISYNGVRKACITLFHNDKALHILDHTPKVHESRRLCMNIFRDRMLMIKNERAWIAHRKLTSKEPETPPTEWE